MIVDACCAWGGEWVDGGRGEESGWKGAVAAIAYHGVDLGLGFGLGLNLNLGLGITLIHPHTNVLPSNHQYTTHVSATQP